MNDKVTLKIATPADLVLDAETARVMLPASKGDMTILPQRAPLVVVLRNGLVQLLDSQGKAESGYFIMGGIAEIAADKCMISTEMVIPEDKITTDEAEKQAQNQELSSEERIFYQEIVNRLRFMKK